MEQLANINWALIAPLIIVQVILAIVALIDIARIHATNGPKWVWVLLFYLLIRLGQLFTSFLGGKRHDYSATLNENVW